MRPGRTFLIGLFVGLALSGVAFAVQRALNPAGSDGVVNGKLVIVADPNRAPINLGLLLADPGSPATNSFWCVDAGLVHHCCIQTASGKRCWNAT